MERLLEIRLLDSIVSWGYTFWTVSRFEYTFNCWYLHRMVFGI
jgi:hypothetical protein